MTLPTAPFGRTGHDSTRLIFGAAALGAMSHERAIATLDTMSAAGINHVDTAADYGASEVRLQPWLAKHRDQVFLATKTGKRSGAEARTELERSFERMGVDHIDLIQLHNLVADDDWAAAFAPGGAAEAMIAFAMADARFDRGAATEPPTSTCIPERSCCSSRLAMVQPLFISPTS